MKLFFIFFHFLIHLGLTKGYHYPRNEETADAHRGMDTLNAPKMRKIEIDRKNADVCESANGTKVGGQCLFFENDRKNWGDAVTSCKAKGQQLAIITNPIAFNAYMNSNLAGQSFWLGGSDTANEGHFVWLDGSPFVNFPWENGNPDNYGNQDCLRWGWKNSFDDSKCSIGFHYICQLKEPQLPTFAWPYVGDGCCNLSTTPKCLKEGGQCIPRNETCVGDVYISSKYCDFNKLKSCQCCVPINCETLNLCKVLNGTCNRTCEGRSVSGEDFCKDSKHCKCCLPEEPEKPHVCPCGQDDNGGCNGQFLPGKWATGHCEKDCSIGTHPLDNHSCNKTGGEDCKCCAKDPTTITTTTKKPTMSTSTLEPTTTSTPQPITTTTTIDPTTTTSTATDTSTEEPSTIRTTTTTSTKHPTTYIATTIPTTGVFNLSDCPHINVIDPACPPTNTLVVGDACFVFIYCKMNFTQARQFCSDSGWSLATPDKQFLEFNNVIPADGEFWLDVEPAPATDPNVPLVWYWQDSVKNMVTLAQWKVGRYNTTLAADERNCASIFRDDALHSFACSNLSALSCESDHL